MEINIGTDTTVVDYTALFVCDTSKLKKAYPPVHPNQYYHHSTVAYKPTDGLAGIEVGKRYTIQITGRVTTDKVDALIVENPKSNNRFPHITLSTAEGVKPVESNSEIARAVAEGKVIPLTDVVEVIEGYSDDQRRVILD